MPILNFGKKITFDHLHPNIEEITHDWISMLYLKI